MNFRNKNGEIKYIYGIPLLIIGIVSWKYYFDNFEKMTYQIIIGVVIIACFNDLYKQIFLKPSDTRDKTPNTKIDNILIEFLRDGKYFFLVSVIMYYTQYLKWLYKMVSFTISSLPKLL